MLETAVTWLVNFVHYLGYPGIFIMAFLESTFAPIPAEVTMIPAGYLAEQGHMNVWIVWFLATIGTICGSLFNYWIAIILGRRFIIRYGRYVLFGEDKLNLMERYFINHGEISIFTGRLIPGVRHFISFPAGLGRMNLKRFCLYTGLGGAIWTGVLLALGYFIGDNEQMVKKLTPLITIAALGLVFLTSGLYIWKKRRKAKSSSENEI